MNINYQPQTQCLVYKDHSLRSLFEVFKETQVGIKPNPNYSSPWVRF